jgi:hypothetical protein
MDVSRGIPVRLATLAPGPELAGGVGVGRPVGVDGGRAGEIGAVLLSEWETGPREPADGCCCVRVEPGDRRGRED